MSKSQASNQKSLTNPTAGLRQSETFCGFMGAARLGDDDPTGCEAMPSFALTFTSFHAARLGSCKTRLNVQFSKGVKSAKLPCSTFWYIPTIEVGLDVNEEYQSRP